MIDITEYFQNNAKENEYYGYKFPNLFMNDTRHYEYYDEIDLINGFKNLINPSNENKITLILQDKYVLMCFYFYKNNYYIKQFPNLFKRPSEKCLPHFMINDIRQYIMKERNDFENKVSWEERRNLINSLEFIKNEDYIISEDMEKVIEDILNSESHFNELNDYDKLRSICDAIEYLLKKKNGKFKKINFNNVSDIIDNQFIEKYRKKIQCFRHASKNSLIERKKYSSNDKSILIKYGILIIEIIVEKVNELNEVN